MKTTKIAKNLPWVIVGLLFIATALSFLDRQVLSFAIIKIKEDIHMSDIDYSRINAAFIIGYAVMFTLAGIIIDKFGTRIGLGFSVLIWSIASAFHALAGNVLHFGIFRFILGVGEGGAFPGAIKAVIEWIPFKKRAFANGIAIGGSAIGAVIAPILCLMLIETWGWRYIFIITGAIGILWTIAWFFLTSKRFDKYKLDNIKQEIGTVDKQFASNPYSIKKILMNKTVWIFILMRILFDPILYFLMFWIPKFLNEYRDMTIEAITSYLWIPYLALGFSNIAGGYFSDKILILTSSINKARKSIMGVAAFLTLSVLLIQYVNTPFLVIGIITLFFLAHGFWITNYVTSIGDIFGIRSTSTIVGLSGSAGAIAGTISSIIIGLVVTTVGYSPLWLWAGLMYPLAFIVFVIFIPVIKRESGQKSVHVS